MTTSDAGQNPIDRLAEEFAERLRHGERPLVAEYVERYPEHADEIRELFPVLLTMERLKPGPAEWAASVPAPGEGAWHPQRLGDYRILREVGRGGMGVVYEAEQMSLGRHVALKVLPSHALLNPTHLERFRREAVSAAKLHHTNIVPVYGVGEADDIHFYAMQFIRGDSLDAVLGDLRRLRREPSPLDAGSTVTAILSGQLGTPSGVVPPEPQLNSGSPPLSDGPTHGAFHRSVANLALQVADALAYAHRQGVLHRDIKPSNLLLDAKGIVWVTDFGLAKAEGSDELTGTGDIVGTLRFMAPERFDGRSLPQGDIYSLGLTLYELLTLRPAFDHLNKAKLIEQILHELPVPPRKVVPHVSRDLETVVLKCLAKDPCDRYATAEELADDLRRFLADRPVTARRTRGAEQFWRWCRRNPAVASLAAVSALLLVVVATVSTVAAIWLDGERGRVDTANANLTAQYEETAEAWHKADELRVRAEKAESATRDRLWEARLVEAKSLSVSRQPGQRYASLRAAREALKLPLPEGRSLNELRTVVIAALCNSDFEKVKEWDGCPPGTTAFALDRTFQRYARADQDGNVTVLRVEGDETLFSLPGVGPSTEYEGLRFSPDGRFLHVLSVKPPNGRLWRLDGPRSEPFVDDKHCGFAFSPDNRFCALAYPDGSVALRDLETEKETRRFKGGLPGSKGMLWNPQRPQIVCWSPKSWQLLDLETEKFDAAVTVPGDISWLDWHPEGRTLAVSNESDFRITHWDARTRRQVRPSMDGIRAAGIVLASNHAGDRLLSTDWSGLWRLWDRNSSRQLLMLQSPGTNLQFSPDDGMVGATTSPPNVRLYRFAPGNEFSSLAHWSGTRAGNYDDRQQAALHPNGRLLAVSTFDGLALVDLDRLEEVATLPGTASLPLAFEPDGGALFTYGSGGLCRWPLRECKAASAIAVGPPSRLLATSGRERWGASRDLQTVAIPDYSAGAKVWKHGDDRLMCLGEQNDVRNCAVSPDGRWVFTGSHNILGPGAQVWDARNAEHKAKLTTESVCVGWFSPNSKWLVTSGNEYRVWEVGTWKEAPSPNLRVFARGCAFSADSKLMALGSDLGVVRLVDPGTGREVASLTAPEQSRMIPVCFTPDGGKLVTVGAETQLLHVFDLRAIRTGLREFGLDWSDAPLPRLVPKPEPLRATVDTRLRSDRPEAQRLHKMAITRVGKGDFVGAVSALRLAVSADPDSARTHNDLAWLLLTGPTEVRDPKDGLVLAERAVALAPDDRACVSTLGVAQYRNGQMEQPVRSLNNSLAKCGGDRDGVELFFLAMCHAKLGDAAEAKDDFARAVKWTEAQRKFSPQLTQEMKLFRSEAEAVLKAH